MISAAYASSYAIVCQSYIWDSIIAFSIAYLIGSIPFGFILSKLSGHGDVRTIGSGNIGATNVLRTGNKRLAALTLCMDILKGPLAIYAAYYLIKSLEHFYEHESCFLYFWHVKNAALLGFFAVLGHMYPLWLKFRGGKGVATTIGVMSAQSPISGLMMCMIWLLVALISRISSLASLSMVVITLVLLLIVHLTINLNEELLYVLAFITALIIWKHRDNIRRLLKGEEPKISFSPSSSRPER